MAPLARRAGWTWVSRSRPADIDGQTELLQELRNLIDNAIRYAGAGAMVTVRVDGHRLAVEDNGPGVPAFERESIFKRFYRGESSASRDGSGLGLSIVREIARIHGAAVALESTPGGGLTVVVTFPAPVPALASGPGPASTDSPGALQKADELLRLFGVEAVERLRCHHIPHLARGVQCLLRLFRHADHAFAAVRRIGPAHDPATLLHAVQQSPGRNRRHFHQVRQAGLIDFPIVRQTRKRTVLRTRQI
jgi:hypothetical protein